MGVTDERIFWLTKEETWREKKQKREREKVRERRRYGNEVVGGE